MHGVLPAQASATDLQAPRSRQGEGATLVLLKNLPFAGELGQPFQTDWIAADSEFQNATIHVHCQTMSPASLSTGLGIRILSSFDTVEAYQVGSNITLTAAGVANAAVTSNLGPMVRVEVENGESVPVYAILSVWLQLKST